MWGKVDLLAVRLQMRCAGWQPDGKGRWAKTIPVKIIDPDRLAATIGKVNNGSWHGMAAASVMVVEVSRITDPRPDWWNVTFKVAVVPNLKLTGFHQINFDEEIA